MAAPYSSFLFRSFACIALLGVVSACANPVVAERVTPADSRKDCAAIEKDITNTSQLKRDARADDEFQWRYVFVVNGFISAWRMNKAEEAAQKRLEELQRIGQEKGCFGVEEKVITPVG